MAPNFDRLRGLHFPRLWHGDLLARGLLHDLVEQKHNKNMLILKMTCAMCGKQHPGEMKIETVFELAAVELEKRIDNGEDGWSLQINDGNLDVYCSPKCAK